MRRDILLISIVLIAILSLSGCLDNFLSQNGYIQYTPVPTTARYNISYGYHISSTGHGKYTLRYTISLPNQPLSGYISNISILYNNYTQYSFGGNSLLRWVVNGRNIEHYDVGISADITVNSFVTDLNSSNSISIENIPSSLVSQYCRVQSTNDSAIPLIDPSNFEIVQLANHLRGFEINAFLVAKNIFAWLKSNTSYKTHEQNNNVQPSIETLHLKTGDCDDLSFLYISLCRAAGIPARFVRGYLVEEGANGNYVAVPHAWAEVFVGFGKEGWIPVECAGESNNVETEIHQHFGLEDVHHIRIFVDNGSNQSMEISLKGPSIEYQIGENVDMQSFATVNSMESSNYKKLTVYPDGRREYI